VALDVARILSKTRAEFGGSDIVSHALDVLETAATEEITILGRRGPHQIAMTPKELGELAHLDRATCRVWTSLTYLKLVKMRFWNPACASPSPICANSPPFPKPIAPTSRSASTFDFFAAPVRVEGDGKVERIVVERTKLDEQLRSVGTGETYAIPCSMVISCIGYQTPSIEGVPYEHGRGRFANVEGRILPGLYCVGWARRGPSGTIGTNRPDGYTIIDAVAEDIGEGTGKTGRPGLDALLDQRGVQVVKFSDWKKIEEAEIARARDGAPREKFVRIEDMIKAGS
jgi:hypothetical protein